MIEKLGVAERLVLLTTLPPEGDILTLRVIRKLRESLELSEEELKTLDARQENGQITWQNANAEMVGEKEVEISPRQHELIADALRKLNDRKQLKMEHVSLYERFVEAPNA